MRSFGSLLRTSFFNRIVLAGVVAVAMSSYAHAETVEEASNAAGGLLQSSPTAGGGNNVNAAFDIVITNAGVSVESTGYGPYDGSDDTAIDVFNNSSNAYAFITVTSTADIDGFDGDGISTFVNGPVGTFGYEGPDVTYSNIVGETIETGGTDTFGNPVSYGVGQTADVESLQVNFTGGLASGGTAYFSLEEDLADVGLSAPTLGNIVTNASGVPEISSTGGGSLAILLIGSVAMLACPKTKATRAD
jgi:hypothetical protein